jgi:UDP-glucose 4-epimerase
MAKRILVTGSSGFIGSHIAADALRQGYKVTGIDIKKYGHAQNGVDFRLGDVAERGFVREIMREGFDYVIHLAAETVSLEFERNLQRAYDVNVGGFLNVIDAAREFNCKHFLYASSSYVYFPDNNFSEDLVLDFAVRRNHYAKSKIINEMLADSYHDVYKMRTTGFRFFNVYGDGEESKNDYTSIVTKFLNMNRRGETLTLYGDGTQAKDLVNIDDVTKIVFMMIEKSRHSVYNIGTGKEIAYKDVAEWINKDNVKCIPNPLTTYQSFSRSDNKRLFGTIGEYKFIQVRDWLKKAKAGN